MIAMGNLSVDIDKGKTMENRARSLIASLQLEPHPEGGYYKEVIRSTMQVVSPAVLADRSAVTDIYFLLLQGQKSRLHRVMHDEIWHFYEGAPLILIDIDSQTLEMREIRLDPQELQPLYTHGIKAGNWQAAYSSGAYSLAGCTVAPGFDFADFQFLAGDVGKAEAIGAKYPHLKDLM
jgi:uncharacterized protein